MDKHEYVIKMSKFLSNFEGMSMTSRKLVNQALRREERGERGSNETFVLIPKELSFSAEPYMSS